MKHLLSQDDGFSLLELLVAIAILSLAIIPMVASQTTAVRSSSKLSEKGYAQIVAENVMTELRLSETPPPTTGTIDGAEIFGGVPFYWQAEVRELTPQKVISISLKIIKEENDKELYEIIGFRKSI